MLELPVEGLAGAGPALARAPPRGSGRSRARRSSARRRPLSGVEEREREVVRVVVVGDPAAEQEVDPGVRRARTSRNSGIVFVATSTSTPSSAQIRKSACVSAPYWSCRIGWTRRAQPDGQRQARRSGSSRRPFRAARCGCRRPGVVAEDPGRDEARWRAARSARALPRRSPASARRRRARAAARRSSPAALARVEEGEVGVLLRRLDEARAEPRARGGSPRGPAGGGRARGRARPDRRPSAIAEAESEARNSIRSSRAAGSFQ